MSVLSQETMCSQSRPGSSLINQPTMLRTELLHIRENMFSVLNPTTASQGTLSKWVNFLFLFFSVSFLFCFLLLLSPTPPPIINPEKKLPSVFIICITLRGSNWNRPCILSGNVGQCLRRATQGYVELMTLCWKQPSSCFLTTGSHNYKIPLAW